MGLLVAGVLLLWCASYSYQLSGISSYGLSAPELEWSEANKMSEESRITVPRSNNWKSGSNSLKLIAKNVPMYIRVSVSEDQMPLFKPERGARPLPHSVKEMLLMTAAPSTTASTLASPVEVLCHLDRIYVRVRRDVFSDIMAYKSLRLGLCPVNQATSAHFYFLYYLDSKCGFKWESKADYVSISTILHYVPHSSGPILRQLPFNIPVQCRYHRIFHSYGVGFYPKLAKSTVLKVLHSAADFHLIAQDASGNLLSGSVSYSLGQPMYFEAKLANPTVNQRVYINKCFVTTSSTDLNATPKYTAIANQGCMIDGKVTQQSRFLTHSSRTSQRFSIGAFIFAAEASTLHLYMHCEITVGALTPTQSAKACNFDFATKTWKELYGGGSVCACCDSSCSPATKDFKAVVSSSSWEVDSKQMYTEPDFKSMMPETFNIEDHSEFDTEHHSEFLNYWDNDY